MALALAAPPKRTHRRPRPELGALHRVVSEYVETFLADRQAADPDGQGVPRFIEKRLRDFVKCGQSHPRTPRPDADPVTPKPRARPPTTDDSTGARDTRGEDATGAHSCVSSTATEVRDPPVMA